MMGESFVDQQMRNSRLSENAVCQGHNGRGESSEGERAAMSACIAAYEAKGFVRE
jgi:hypothetical protein